MNDEMKTMKYHLEELIDGAKSVLDSINDNDLDGWEVGLLGRQWRTFESAADSAGFDTSASITD